MSNQENVSEIYVVKAEQVNYCENSENIQEPLVDEYVYVEEKYCGPFTSCIGGILFILFWPASIFVGCFPCDKRVVKKKVVSR